MLTRRTFLSACAATGLSPLVRASRPLPGTRSLVLLQLTGGNDGLSTVVPYGDDAYHRARSATRHRGRDLLRLDDHRGLHGGLKRLAREWHQGRVAIVEGLGYPDMVRSHFMAYEVWHTADRRGRAAGDGWVGRLARAAWAEEDHPELVVHLGGEAPWSVRSRTHPPVALTSPTSYRWFGERPRAEPFDLAGEPPSARTAEDGAAGDGADEHVGRDRSLAHLREVLDDARSSSRRIREAAVAHVPRAEYPRSPLGAALRDVSALLHGDLGARVLSVELRGFDTHARQRPDHDRRMSELDGALGAFLQDLRAGGHDERTAVLVFSEFGRRVSENASEGTDHGKAGPGFLIGSPVKGGLYGAHPSLDELDDGDLAWTTDFRSLYGEVIEGWFGVPMERVLGERHPRLGIVPD